MKQYQKEAEEFAKEGSKQAIERANHFNSEHMTPNDGIPLNYKKAYQDIKNGQIEETDELIYLRSDQVQKNLRDNSHVHAEEFIFKRADDLLNNMDQPMLEGQEPWCVRADTLSMDSGFFKTLVYINNYSFRKQQI